MPHAGVDEGSDLLGALLRGAADRGLRRRLAPGRHVEVLAYILVRPAGGLLIGGAYAQRHLGHHVEPGRVAPGLLRVAADRRPGAGDGPGGVEVRHPAVGAGGHAAQHPVHVPADEQLRPGPGQRQHPHVREHGESAQALYLLGRARDAQGELEPARALYRRALALNSEHTFASLRLAYSV